MCNYCNCHFKENSPKSATPEAPGTIWTSLNPKTRTKNMT